MDELALQKFGVGRQRVAEVEHYPGLGVTASPIHRKVDTDRGHPSGEGHWRSFESSPDQRLYNAPQVRSATKLRGRWAFLTPRQNKVEQEKVL